MIRFSKYLTMKGFATSLQAGDIGTLHDLSQTLQDFIDANVMGWEFVTCNICGRNSDYEHNSSFPDCPVGMAMALREKISPRRFRIVTGNGYSHCRYDSHFRRV